MDGGGGDVLGHFVGGGEEGEVGGGGVGVDSEMRCVCCFGREEVLWV